MADRFLSPGDETMKFLVTLSMAFLLTASSPVRAQEPTIHLPKAIDEIKRHLLVGKSEWKHRLTAPGQRSDASVSHWEYGSRVVRVSVFSPDISREAMAGAIREFAAEQNATKLEGLGDEGYACGAGGKSVVFILGNLTIAITTNAHDPLEGKKLSHEFARIIAEALRHAAN
jgi:hypothetical protein